MVVPRFKICTFVIFVPLRACQYKFPFTNLKKKVTLIDGKMIGFTLPGLSNLHSALVTVWQIGPCTCTTQHKIRDISKKTTIFCFLNKTFYFMAHKNTIRNFPARVVMLANSGRCRVQKHENVTAPVGETGPQIDAPSGETNICKNCPKNYRVVQEQEKHKNIKEKPI